jgi:magnesium transporter
VIDLDLLAPKIQELIETHKWSELRQLLSELPAPDIAGLLTALDKSSRVLVFRLLRRQLSSEVFAYLDSSHKDALLKDLTDIETRYILENLSPDDRTDFLEELPGQAIQRLMNLLSPSDLWEAKRLLGYPEESVGRLMTPDYVAVNPEWTITRALEHIRRMGKDSETINVVYVTDRSWKLLDALDLRKFILADPEDKVSRIMDYSFVSITAYEDREKAVRLIQHYDLYALPVLDSQGILIGIVTVDDVMDIAEEEVTEDFQKGAAMEPLKLSYRDATTWSLYRKRIVWLTALLFVNLLSAGVIAAYEETLASAIALAFFIPLLMGSGGNVGTQSSTLMVRAIATNDVDLGQWFRPVLRELSTGLLLGATMGIAGWFLGVFKGGIEIAVVVSTAMLSIVVVANLIGVVIPLVLSRLKVDPAVASSPLISSISDVTCLMIYFIIASRVLGL